MSYRTSSFGSVPTAGGNSVGCSSSGVVSGDLVLLAFQQAWSTGVDLYVGTAPATTLSCSASSGSGVTATAGAGAPFAGTSADIGKVIYTNYSTTSTGAYLTITGFTSTTVCTVTITRTLYGSTIPSGSWLIADLGFTLVEQVNSSGQALAVWAKTAGASEPATYSALGTSGQPPGDLSLLMHAYSGRSGTTVSASTGAGGTGTPPKTLSGPTLASAAAGDDIVVFATAALSGVIGSATTISLASWASRQATTDVSLTTLSGSIDYVNWGGGSTGAINPTLSWTNYSILESSLVAVRMPAVGGLTATKVHHYSSMRA